MPTGHLFEPLLPPEILARASLRGNEYAWSVDDIPEVIRAAQKAGLVNLGGQLQFRLSNGGTCECYWVDVDTSLDVQRSLPWNERVAKSAEFALARFAEIRAKFDFLAEGKRAFARHLETEADSADAMCFVWHVLDAATAKANDW